MSKFILREVKDVAPADKNQRETVRNWRARGGKYLEES